MTDVVCKSIRCRGLSFQFENRTATGTRIKAQIKFNRTSRVLRFDIRLCRGRQNFIFLKTD